jgi:ketosteroid isomerase-like protein
VALSWLQQLAGDHVGRDATLAVLGRYGEAGGGTLKAEVVDIMASDDHVAGVARDTASVGGKALDVRSTVVFAMRDGKITEAWHYIDDLASFNAFLA